MPVPMFGSSSRRSALLLVLLLCALCSLPLLLGEQARSLTSADEAGITSVQGNALKQAILLVVYGLAALLALPRLDAAGRAALGLPLLALAAWTFASVLWSDLPALTLRRAVSLAGSLMLGLAMALRWKPARLLPLLNLTALIVLAASLLAALALPDAGVDPEGRLRGVFAHKNSIGMYAAFAALVAAATLLGAASGRRLAAAVLLLALAALALADSTAPLPSATLALAVLLLARGAARAPSRAALVLATLAAAAAAALLLPWLAAQLGALAELTGKDADYSGRTTLWAYALEHVARSPWLGYGHETFWNGPAGLAFYDWKRFAVPHAHNGPLQLLLDGGIPALLAYLWLATATLARLHEQLRGERSREAAWMAACLAFYFGANIAETHLWSGNDLYTALFAYACVRLRLERGAVLTARGTPGLSFAAFGSSGR